MDNTTSSTFTEFANNETLIKQVAHFFNVTVANVTNQSVMAQANLFDLYEAYRTREKEQLNVYKTVAYVIGSLIILSNLTVVISSGLILRRGQQPKSTYLLLGNVSLADTIIGIAIIFGALIDNATASNYMCIFQIGMIVCAAIVSIFSVGLIAVDRYCYILHGLYYQRYFNTTRVRIAIAIIWMIGLTLGFMPATGWVNQELKYTRCYYTALFPGPLILFNSILSLIPIILVVVLYSIILVKALRNVKDIQSTQKSVNFNSHLHETSKLRIYRGNTNLNRTPDTKIKNTQNEKIRRCASFNLLCDHSENRTFTCKSKKSKSISDLSKDNSNRPGDILKDDSKLSILTLESSYSEPSTVCSASKIILNKICKTKQNTKSPLKPREPNKWRAITVVMLTTGSFLFTWLPFFVIVIFYVFCEDKLTNPRCTCYKTLLGGALATLAFLNSILNPLIYAWWHKGFQKTVRTLYRRHCCKRISFSSSSCIISRMKSQE